MALAASLSAALLIGSRADAETMSPESRRPAVDALVADAAR